MNKTVLLLDSKTIQRARSLAATRPGVRAETIMALCVADVLRDAMEDPELRDSLTADAARAQS